MVYSIYGFDKQSKNILFKNTKNGKKFEINCEIYNDYRKPSKQHFYNSEINEVILVGNESSYNVWRAVSVIKIPEEIIINNKKYHKCNQYQFDKWHTIMHPHTHNAIVYNILKEKLDF